jgi:hypothetical protein
MLLTVLPSWQSFAVVAYNHRVYCNLGLNVDGFLILIELVIYGLIV